MKHQPLRYYMHDGPAAFRFELAGVLNHEGALRIDQDWITASSMIGDRRRILDITFVTGVDEEGHALITRWHRNGARIVANSKASRALAESILCEPVPEDPSAAGQVTLSDRTWLPFHPSFFARAVALALLTTVLFPIQAVAATLKPETVTAWDQYVESASVDLQKRVLPGGSFLWTFEDAGRAASVSSGEIVVAPMPGENPKKVPGGLIHHWIGAAFLPNLKLDDILAVTSDYDRYKDFYRPYVIDSKSPGARSIRRSFFDARHE